MGTSFNTRVFFILAVYALLFWQQSSVDAAQSLYERNRRNLRAQNSNRSTANNSSSQRRYFGRDYYFVDNRAGARERTVGRPTHPW